MPKTQEQHVHIWIDFIRKLQIGLSDQIRMRFRKMRSRSRAAVHKINGNQWMIHQQAKELTTRVARSADDSDRLFSCC